MLLLLPPHFCCHYDTFLWATSGWWSINDLWWRREGGGDDEGRSQKYIRAISKVNYTYSCNLTPTHPLPPYPQFDAMKALP